MSSATTRHVAGSIRYECEQCRRDLEVPDHYALLIMFCRHCYAPTQIPAAESGEQWREIRDTRSKYEVSSFGRIRRIRGGRGAKRGALLSPAVDAEKGLSKVSLSGIGGGNRSVYVHRLVWEAFHGPLPPKTHVGHKSPERDEHAALCNALSNLELLPGRWNR